MPKAKRVFPPSQISGGSLSHSCVNFRFCVYCNYVSERKCSHTKFVKNVSNVSDLGEAPWRIPRDCWLLIYLFQVVVVVLVFVSVPVCF